MRSFKFAGAASILVLTALVVSGCSQPATQPAPQPPMPMMSGMPMHSGDPAMAGKPMMPMQMPMGASASPAASSPMMASMDKMSKDMAAVPMTGNADADFVGMMIPHHQGAIDMARYELANGKDPAMRKMARNVIAAQEKEIRDMKAWQAKHPVSR